jgi:putative transposase
MGRPHRAALGGYVYHVLNRANARMTIFEHDADFEAFEQC